MKRRRTRNSKGGPTLFRGTIVYRPIDIFASGCKAVVNPVNCVGVMGRGLALAFRQRYPVHFASYREACRRGTLRPGTVHIDDLGIDDQPRFIIAVPTKRHWRDASRIGEIKHSVDAMVDALIQRDIPSVAIPKLGCGLGGLAWPSVHAAILPSLRTLAHRCRVVVLASQPSNTIGDI